MIHEIGLVWGMTNLFYTIDKSDITFGWFESFYDDLIVIGINEWFAPQISEHWPNARPVRLIVICDWLIRPGFASTFTPAEGNAHEWITSDDVIISRIVVLVGISIWGSEISRRATIDGFMKESVSSNQPGISYDQYHWWPVIFMEAEGLARSSVI